MKAKLLVVFLMATVAGSAMASGGVFGGGRLPSQQPQIVDPLYDHGKAVYTGKVRKYGKLKYCVTEPGNEKLGKLKRKTLKPYKNGDIRVFINNLYNCDQPDQLIATVLVRDDLIAVLHYINKRYRLRLNA